VEDNKHSVFDIDTFISAWKTRSIFLHIVFFSCGSYTPCWQWH